MTETPFHSHTQGRHGRGFGRSNIILEDCTNLLLSFRVVGIDRRGVWVPSCFTAAESLALAHGHASDAGWTGRRGGRGGPHAETSEGRD